MRLTRPVKALSSPFLAGLVGACLVVCMIAVVILSLNLRHGLELQAAASSDNTQWTFSQLDVEYVNLSMAMLTLADKAQSEGAGDLAPELAEVRKRFDILFSRATILREGTLFAPLQADPSFAQGIRQVSGFMTRHIDAIDSSDDRLLATLPAMIADLQTLGPEVKLVISGGIEAFAGYSDAQRLAIARNLIALGLVMAAVVSLLVLLTASLLRLNQIKNAHALQLGTTLARTEAIVTAAIDAILVTDTDGLILDFNPAAEAMFGWTRQEVVGSRLDRLLLAENDGAGGASLLSQIGRENRKRRSARRRDGEVFPVELSIAEARHPDGNKVFVAYLRDLSAEVANALALHQARDDAMAGERTKADLLAVMSHEMRTPLNGMLGMIELLGESGLTPDQRRYLRAMQKSGEILLHHVDDVLKVAKLESGTLTIQYERVDLPELIQEIFTNQSATAVAKGNKLLFSPDANMPKLIQSDRFQLRQVLLNLIGNAIKFTSDGKVQVVSRLDRAANMIELLVIDTGIGIAAADRERVFEDFVTLDASYTRESGGTGLGLGITRRIVKGLGGSVTAEANPEGGSLFRVRLPLQQKLRLVASTPDPEAQGQAVRPAVPALPLQILLAEDNEINRMLLQEMLGKLGHRVTEAHDGRQAVALAEQSAFDLILMDVSMPHLDGVEATRTIRQGRGSNRTTPVIALTAHSLPKDLARLMSAGAQDMLIKPISRTDLQGMIAKVQAGHFQGPLNCKTHDELRGLLGVDRHQQMLRSFAQEAEAGLHLLGAADPSPGTDLTPLGKTAHRLAGAAAMLGADNFAALLCDLQDICEHQNHADYPSVLQQLQDCWRITHAAITADLVA